jgi:hypothetical protein
VITASNDGNRGTLFTAVCLGGALIGVLCIVLASRYFQLPDDRGSPSEQESFAPLAYLKLRPFDSAGYLALSESSGQGAADGALRLRSHAVSAAALLAPVDPQVIRAQAALAFARGDVRVGLDKTARLAAISPMDQADAFSVLAAHVAHPAWPDFAAARLSAGWEVSDQFLLKLCNEPQLTRYAFSVAAQFVRFRPLSPAASHCVENRAIASGDILGAYRLRLSAARSLPSRIGFVFNGEFELPVSGSRFDWTIEPGGEYREGFVAAIRPDGGPGGLGKALHVRFTGRPVQSPIVQQYLALPVGQYRLSYLSQQTAQSSTNYAVWKLKCAANDTPLITETWSSSAAASGWTKSEAPFSVGVNCPGQVLSLEAKSRLAALEGMRGTLLVDNVRVEQQ